jgi:hypothetical protein
MAIIAKEEKSLKKQYIRYLLYTIVLIPGGVTVTWLTMPNIKLQIIGIVMILLGTVPAERFVMLARGSIGENKVTKQLKQLPDDYIIINDVMIPNGDRTAQIDHIVIGDNGIFCIETKSHVGTIYGSETAHNWKQVRKSEKGRNYNNTFYSPVKQCMTHVMALKTLLKDDSIIQPIVVFTKATNYTLGLKY